VEPNTDLVAMSGLCSLALYPSGVKLHFGKGAQLSKSDPNKLLQGRGTTVRHVVLTSVADFDRAEIEVLMAAASEDEVRIALEVPRRPQPGSASSASIQRRICAASSLPGANEPPVWT